jgi:hypothetical protein
MRQFHFAFALWALCAPFLVCAADMPKPAEEAKRAPDELALTTERVIVFKDGYCLVVKRGVATANATGEVYTEAVPDAAVLGSFWAVPTKDRLISMDAGVVTTIDKTAKKAPCIDHLALIKANQGKACTVILNDNEKTTYFGTILSVLATETEQPALAADPSTTMERFSVYASRMPESWPQPTPGVSTVTTLSGSIFVLRTEAGDVALPVTQVRTLTIKEMALSADRMETTTKTTKRLTFRFEKGGQEKDILLMYFTPGLRWIPTYRVELAAEDAAKKEARIALQAELLNEVEDLDGVPVDIVVGVPNFRFKDVISPFSLETGMRNALQQAAPQLMSQFSNGQVSNAYFRNDQGESQRPGGLAANPNALQLPPELTSAGAQDLFVYHLPKLKLKKGHRAAVPIFEAVAPYREVYTWNVRVQRHDIETAPSGQGVASPLVLAQNQVWHQLELENTTQVPWTTGSAMVLQGQQPLAQELLTYTAPGDGVRIPLTVSVDTRGTFTEKETGRDLKALRFNNSDYVRISKEASLTLTNRKKTAIPVEITCQIGGAADEVTHDGKVMLLPFDGADWKDYRSHPAVNNHSVLTWRVQIEPGKAFTPTIKYHYFASY